MEKYVNEANLARFWDNIQDQIGNASQEQVDAWLDAHPEATTTVQDGSITDVKLADGAVTDVKLAQTGGVLEAVQSLGIRHINLFDTTTIIEGKYIGGNGGLDSNSSFFASDYIDVSSYDTITLSYTHIAHWYASDKSHISAVDGMNTLAADATVSVPDNAYYLRFSTYNTNLNLAQVGEGVTRDNYVAHDRYILTNLDYVDNATNYRIAKLETMQAALNYESNGNLYNVHNIIRGYYINPANGAITSAPYQSFAYSPSYIEVTAGESICSTDRMFIAYYDSDLNVLSALQMDATKTTVIPDGASFARFSCSSVDHNLVVVMRGATVDASLGAYSFRLDGLYIPDETIVVDANGNGDYTSFTEAVYKNVDNEKPIVVKSGTYDIKAEYVALFGQTVVDNLADSTSGINNFQYGIRIHDRTVIFEAGSHLVCDWSGKTVNYMHRFCAFRIEQNAELIGLDLDCTATWYAIHDDYGTADESPYTITYRNCRVVGHDLVNANCIGGGCHKFSRHILENCYFNNNVNSSDQVLSADVRYHNTNAEGAEPEVYISNCYFSNNVNLTYYGTQTTKMRAYVNNCYAPKGVNKRAESSSSTVDNVVLHAWNNQTN